MTDSLPKGYKPWLIASVAILVASLVLLAIAVIAAFINFAEVGTPLWVVIVGALAMLGMLVGFGGLFLLMATAGYKSFRDGRKVQVLPPERSSAE